MSALARALGACAAFSARRALFVLVVLGALAVLAAWGSWRYARIDSDLSKLIRPSPSLSWYQHDLAYKAAFPELQQTAVVVVSGTDAAAVDRSAQELAAALEQRSELAFVFAPSLSPFLRDHRLYYLQTAQLSDWRRGLEYNYGVVLRLADEATLANAAFTFADQLTARPRLPLPDPLASLASSFARSAPDDLQLDLHVYPPLVDNTAVTHYQLLIVKGEQRLDEPLPNAALVTLLRATVAAHPVPAGVSVRLTGEVPLAHEEIQAALSGIGIAGGISLLLLAVILGIGVRSLRIIVAVFALLAVGTALTLGWATLAVGSYNTLALMFVVMFFGLGVDFAVHFALRMREPLTPAVEDPAAVIRSAREAAQDIGPSLVLCMLSTSIAFLAFVPTAYGGMAELGLISAGGMLIAMALSITLLPALFSVLRVRAQVPPRLPRAWRPLPPRFVLAGTLLLGCLALPAALQLRFDYSVLAMRDASTEAMSTLLELQREGITTDYSIGVLAAADAAEPLANRLRQLEAVGAVFTPTDLVPVDQPAKARQLADLADLFATIEEVLPAADGVELLPTAIEALQAVRDRLRDEDEADFQALLAGLKALAGDPDRVAQLDAKLKAQLEAELAALRRLLAAAPFTFGDLPADLRGRFVAPDARLLLTVQPAAPLVDRVSTETFIDAVAAVAPNYAGRAVVEWGVGGVVVAAFAQAAALALGAIVVLLLVYFRSITQAACVLAPLLLATLLTFAVAAVTDLSLNMANILVVPLIFGLGVDTGIHVVDRFRHAGSVDAVMASSTSRAVLISGLTTIGTFFALIFSPHKGAASVGLLLFIAISLMLLSTFVVLPALLRLRSTTPVAAG